MSLPASNVIYVDVDGTLLFWPGKPGRQPGPGEAGFGELPKINKPLADCLRSWHKKGRTLVVWSRGGPEHCKLAAKLCGLNPDACLYKPEICIDDHANTVTAGERKGFIVLDQRCAG